MAPFMNYLIKITITFIIVFDGTNARTVDECMKSIISNKNKLKNTLHISNDAAIDRILSITDVNKDTNDVNEKNIQIDDKLFQMAYKLYDDYNHSISEENRFILNDPSEFCDYQQDCIVRLRKILKAFKDHADDNSKPGPKESDKQRYFDFIDARFKKVNLQDKPSTIKVDGDLRFTNEKHALMTEDQLRKIGYISAKQFCEWLANEKMGPADKFNTMSKKLRKKFHPETETTACVDLFWSMGFESTFNITNFREVHEGLENSKKKLDAVSSLYVLYVRTMINKENAKKELDAVDDKVINDLYLINLYTYCGWCSHKNILKTAEIIENKKTELVKDLKNTYHNSDEIKKIKEA